MTTIDVMKLPSADREPSAHRFDYKGLHRYLITLPTFRERPLFTEQEKIFVLLNVLRESAEVEKFDVYAYCFLPDRLLLIVRGRDESSDMKQFLRLFRAGTSDATAPILGHPLWSKKYIERVLRKAEESRTVARDLFLAPVRTGLVTSLADYSYFGSFVVSVPKILGEVMGSPKRSPEGGRRRGGTRNVSGRPGAFRGKRAQRPRR
jgi:putative transposase